MARGVLMTEAEANKLGLVPTTKKSTAQRRAHANQGKLSAEQEKALVKFIRRKKISPQSREGRKALKEKATALANKYRRADDPQETISSNWVTRFIDRRLMQEEKNRELAEKLQSGKF